MNLMIQQGWQCPCCSRIYSPITSICFYCPPTVETAPNTSPPQRHDTPAKAVEWVGLTPQERDEINEQVYGAVPHYVAFAHALEAKLKEKNMK